MSQADSMQRVITKSRTVYTCIRMYSEQVPFPRICMMGAPGSGKGTVSKYLKNEFDLNTISTGDILRDHIDRETEIGKRVKLLTENGDLVPDSLMMELFEDEIKQHSQGWILDGLPRTRRQAESVEDLLKSLGMGFNAVYFIDVPDNEIISRISGRLVHAPSGRTYHVEYNPPKEKNRDDVTGEPLTQRIDDKPETVRSRLEKFHSQTKPVLDFFNERDLLVRVNASTSDEAFSIIKPNLKSILAKQ